MPETREVRQNARDVIHRTTTPPGGRVTTVCEMELVHLAADPRTWRGSAPRELTECATCFADAVVVGGEIKPGDLVTLGNNTMGNLPSNPRDWHDGKVYVYVGPAPHYRNRSVILVEEGWLIRENTDRMPPASEPANLSTPRLEAWSCQTPLMAHAPQGTDPDEVLLPRIRRARNRLIALRPEPIPNPPSLEPCVEGGHPATPHTHTTNVNPNWGTPGRNPTGVTRVMRDGNEVQFAKGEHLTPTTERETQPVPPEQPAHEYPVGTDIYPITNQHIRALGPGSVVTVVSSNRGVEHGDRIQFGCKDFPHRSLREARATVRYLPSGIICEADITIDGVQDYLTMAGQRISLGELRDYATSVIVKEIVERPVENALIMEHGFYGCAVHDNEVIFVGNGHPRGRTEVAPLVGKLHPINDEENRLTGTVGQAGGLRQVTFADCTPVPGAATASTMHLVQARSWALVPATDGQIARVRAMVPGRRFGIGRTASEVVVACNMDGVPSVVPAAAEAVPVF